MKQTIEFLKAIGVKGNVPVFEEVDYGQEPWERILRPFMKKPERKAIMEEDEYEYCPRSGAEGDEISK